MKRIITLLALAAVLVTTASCKKDKRDIRVFSATVTFKIQPDESFFMEIDDSTAAVVLNENIKEYPFKKKVEKRAYVNCYIDMDQKAPAVLPSGLDSYKEVRYVTLATLDTILTKAPVQSKGSLQDDIDYGCDPLGIILSGYFPVTVIEDGYLTVCFRMEGGLLDVQHEINLVTGVDEKNPYVVELHHNAHGDEPMNISRPLLISFPLKDLPDTEGKDVVLTLRWNSMVSGKMEEAKFKYRSRTDW